MSTGDLRLLQEKGRPILQRHGAVPIAAFRSLYGARFARGVDDGTPLGRVFDTLDERALRQLVRDEASGDLRHKLFVATKNGALGKDYSLEY